MQNPSGWKLRGRSDTKGSVTAFILVLVVGNICTIGGMVASSLLSALLGNGNKLDKRDFKDYPFMSMQNFLLIVGCSLQSTVAVVFILLAMRSGVSSFSLFTRTSALLMYGSLVVGFGGSYILLHWLPPLLHPHLTLSGVVSEITTFSVAMIGLLITACGCFKNTVYNFVAAASILGACIGAIRGYQVQTYFGSLLIESSWNVLVNFMIFIAFYAGNASISASLLARGYLQRSLLNVLCGIILPVALAGGFGCFTMYPVYQSSMINHTIIRYCVGSACSGLACIFAIVAFTRFRIKPTCSQAASDDTESIKFAKSLMTSAPVIPRADSSQTSV